MSNQKSKSSKKKKIIITSVAAALAITIGVSAFFILKPNKNSGVPIIKVQKGDITEHLESTCTVVSANQGNFEIIDGTYVKSVNVRVGDEVKEGDLLATFDTGSLDSLLKKKAENYSEAKKAYEKYEGTSADATGELAALSKKIKALEKEVVNLRKQVGKADGTEANRPELIDLRKKLSEIFGNDSLAFEFLNRVISSSTSMEKTIDLLEEILNGVNVKASDFTALLNGSPESKKLIESQIKMIELKVKKSLLQLQSTISLENMYFSVMEAAKEDLDETTQAIQELNKGWIAEKDGIIREVNIKAKEKYEEPQSEKPSIENIDISSALSSLTSSTPDFAGIIKDLFPAKDNGMVVEYYPLEATFTIGKEDYFKISLNQPVELTSASDETFEGYISYINPVANESGININSMLGTGATGSIMEGKVTIPHPNKSVIIGLDLDLRIKLETQKDAVLVPVESILNAEDGTYVYIYDSESKRIAKTAVKTGLFDGSHYQILSGCKEGDLIIKLPNPKLDDGEKIRANLENN